MRLSLTRRASCFVSSIQVLTNYLRGLGTGKKTALIILVAAVGSQILLIVPPQSLAALLPTRPFSPPPPDPVIWTNFKDTTFDGVATLNKNTSSCAGCDAGAVSVQTLFSGNGSVSFTASSGSKGYIGLGHDATDNASLQNIDFGIIIDGTSWVVRENGSYRTEGSYSTNDVFRIAVEGNQVKYYKGPNVNTLEEIYASTVAPSYPLVVDTDLYLAGSKIYNAIVDFGGGGSSSLQLSKEYIYAGSRLLAVEDANSN